jgi:hypothetical protein
MPPQLGRQRRRLAFQHRQMPGPPSPSRCPRSRNPPRRSASAQRSSTSAWIGARHSSPWASPRAAGSSCSNSASSMPAAMAAVTAGEHVARRPGQQAPGGPLRGPGRPPLCHDCGPHRPGSRLRAAMDLRRAARYSRPSCRGSTCTAPTSAVAASRSTTRGGPHGARPLTPHFHDEYLICAQLAGHEECQVAGKLHTFSAGDLVFINPQQVHTGNARGSSDLAYITLYVDRGVVDGLAAELADDLGSDRSARRSPEFTQVRAPDRRELAAELRALLALVHQSQGTEGPLDSSRALDVDVTLHRVVAGAFAEFSNLRAPLLRSTNRVSHRKIAPRARVHPGPRPGPQPHRRHPRRAGRRRRAVEVPLPPPVRPGRRHHPPAPTSARCGCATPLASCVRVAAASWRSRSASASPTTRASPAPSPATWA